MKKEKERKRMNERKKGYKFKVVQWLHQKVKKEEGAEKKFVRG